MTRTNFDRIAAMGPEQTTATLAAMAGYRGTAPFTTATARMRALLPPTGDIVEVGPGAGEDARDLAAAGYRVIGVDVRDDLAVPVGWDLRVGEASALPVADASADAMWANRVVHHLDDLPGFLAEARRVLRAGAALVLTWPDHTLARTSSAPVTAALRAAVGTPHATRANPLSSHDLARAARQAGLRPGAVEVSACRFFGSAALGYAFPAGHGLDRGLVVATHGQRVVDLIDGFAGQLRSGTDGAWSSVHLATMALRRPD